MDYIKAKASALASYMRDRVSERSTWAFWLGSATAVAAFPWPASVFFAIVLIATGFLPDGTVLPKKPNG